LGPNENYIFSYSLLASFEMQLKFFLWQLHAWGWIWLEYFKMLFIFLHTNLFYKKNIFENFSISKTNIICAESVKVLHYSKWCMSCACGHCKSHVNRTELFDKNFKLLNKCFSYFKDGHTNPVISGLVQFQPCNLLLIL
jgi:hypothetical protein